MRLPVTVTFHPETETPLSLASRLARAMAYPSMTSLLGDTMARAVFRGEEDAVKLLSSWSGVAADQLRRFAVPVSEQAGEWRLGDAVFRKEMRVAGRFRFCPRCLVEDIENGAGRPQGRPYERAAWLTTAVTSCTRHRELLVEADDGAPMSDVGLFVSEGCHLRCDPGSPVAGSEIEVDAYIEGRIAGNRTRSFIDRQEVHVLLMLFHFVGWLVHNRLPDFRIGGVTASSMGIRAVGFNIVKGGKDEIEAVVKAAIDLHRPAALTITEFFGPMVRHLRRNVKAPSYAEAIELFQTIVERHVPVGPGDRFVTTVEQRQVHSVRSAGLEYSMDRLRVRKLLEERGVIEPSRLSDRQVYFSVSDADNVLGGAARSMTTTEMAEALQTHEDRVRDLIERGMLPVSENGVKGDRPFYRVEVSEFERFRQRLFGRSPVASSDLVTLAQACRRKSLSIDDILEMVVEGRLNRVAYADGSRTMDSILVDVAELPVSVGDWGGADDYLSMTEVKNVLATTDATVSALVSNGVLPIEVRTNPRTRRPQAFVHRSTVDWFLDSHLSLYGIARGWRRNIARMKGELDKNGMKPVFEASGKIATYYRKKELSEASLLPPNA
ncbi:DNA binding domain, excisionase family [Agrobacterium sp. DSM 25558]|uniref:TniQ family protein n=1 Tax=Agrobacterium sp. DSM 25558 TaxID=1907665 RepID=UPI00097256CC|nr:TniQ family protein [Agrobacterium sp. DSM 25558]SCX03850.1 DNA binding domain, excisionase family [Agrobacterium sp. DSM 25558]